MKSDFNEIFDKIYTQNGEKIEKMRKNMIFKKIIWFLTCILVFIGIITIGIKYGKIIIFLIFSIFLLFMILYIMDLSNKYTKEYKKEIIKSLINEIDSTYEYSVKKGVTVSEYIKSGFEKRWDKYCSEDYISGKLDENSSFEMSQVKTIITNMYTDDKGNISRVNETSFIGMFGIVNISGVFLDDIKIYPNSTIRKYKVSRVEMESTEFEKYFDVFSNNRVHAMEILTPESIERITELRNILKNTICIRMIENKVYFRISCGDIFEAPIFKKGVSFDLLYKYYSLINIPRTLYEIVKEAII